MLNEDISFVLLVAAPVGLIVIPLYRAHRRGRRNARAALRGEMDDHAALDEPERS